MTNNDVELKKYCGPIWDLLNDPTVVEISLCDLDGKIFVSRFGVEKEMFGTWDVKSAAAFIRYCSSKSTTDYDRHVPIVSGRIPGTPHRIEAALPPVVENPIFSIRRHRQGSFPLETFFTNKTSDGLSKLKNGITDQKNIIIVGGTGSGKTGLLNSCLSHLFGIQPMTRIISIEDTPELQLDFLNRSQLHTTEHVNMDRLLMSSLRLAPDRIIVGEVRTGDALLTLLKAWNSGHPGGLTSLHANSALEAISKLESLLLEVTQSNLMKVITASVDWIVYIKRGHGAPIVCGIYNLKTEKYDDFE